MAKVTEGDGVACVKFSTLCDGTIFTTSLNAPRAKIKVAVPASEAKFRYVDLATGEQYSTSFEQCVYPYPVGKQVTLENE